MIASLRRSFLTSSMVDKIELRRYLEYNLIMLIAIFIFITGILAGFIGALVGGGGLISVPALMLLGVPPQSAIATNRLGSFGYSTSAIVKYWKEKKINWRLALIMTLISLPGTYLGTKILLEIDKVLLTRITGITLLVMLPLVFLKNKLGDVQKEIPKSHTFIGSIAYFFISIYGSVVGAGTGILARFDLMLLFRMKAIDSNATDIVVGFLSSLLGLTLLLKTGLIHWVFGFLLLIGMIFGGWMGAHTAIKKGDEWVKIMFIIFTLVMGLKLLFFT